MRKLESFILGVVFGFVPILFCLMVVVSIWWFAELLTDENGPYLALAALIVGIIIDLVFLKRWVRNAYQSNIKAVAAVYGFYAFVLWVSCMGMPVLIFPWGMMAGVYIARRMYHTKASENGSKHHIEKTALFTAAVMSVICCLMILLAMVGNVGPESFDGFFKAIFKADVNITVVEFCVMIFLGACAMVLVQYGLMKVTAKVTLRLCGL
jgi:hypothetical protein